MVDQDGDGMWKAYAGIVGNNIHYCSHNNVGRFIN